MASIINSTDTGGGGLITTGDSSDELQLQTAETTAVTIDSSQNVGIGTTTPATFLHLNGANTAFRGQLVVQGPSNTFSGLSFYKGNTAQTDATLNLYSDNSTNEVSLQAGQTTGFFTVRTGGTTERMRITDDGYLRLAGGGIQFNGDTAAANALDDYEEGTWTPVIADAASGGNTGSASISHATYVKIGKLVTIQATLTNIVTTGMTSANPIFVRDLPFVSASNNNCVGSVLLDTVALQGSRTYAISYCGQSDTWITFSAIGTATTDSGIDIGDFTSGASDIVFTITYEVA